MTNKRSSEEIVYAPSPWPARFTQFAFLLALAIVIARATITEQLRDSTDVVPLTTGQVAAPKAAGPATSLTLDLLACVPAMIVLVRRVIERRGYALRMSSSLALLGAFALW